MTGMLARTDLLIDVVFHLRHGEHVEHALARPTEHVEELIALAHLDGVAGDDDVGGGDVARDVLTEVAERLADAGQADAGIEQRLHHPELQEVLVGVAAPAPAALGNGERGLDEPRARPVVQLAIADADDLGGLGAAETLLYVVRHGPTPSRVRAHDRHVVTSM